MKRIIVLFIALISIQKSFAQAPTLFSLLSPEKTGILFKNDIKESKNMNVFLYEYLYNGGGVAVGDINNDGLPDLYFTGTMVPNRLYLNQGNFVFKDITDSAKVNGGWGMKTGVTMVDINCDGYLDIYVCKSILPEDKFRRNNLFINNHNNTFTESAKEYGLDDASYSTQAYFYDMDVDGDLDMVLINHPKEMLNANKIQLTYDKNNKLIAVEDTQRQYVSYRYYENNNNHFTDKTIAAGLGTNAFGLSAVIDDFNDDGYPDIYSCNDYHQPDYLFINNKNGTFTNHYEDYFKHGSYSSMGSDYADINNDGFCDLITVDMMAEDLTRQKELKGPGNYDNFNKRVQYGFGVQYVKNVLQLNNGNHTYSDIAYLSGMAYTDWSWAPLIADFDNDGNKDIYITNGYLRDETNMDFTVFKADSIRKEVFKALNHVDAMKVLDAIPSTPLLNYYYHNNGNLSFENQSLNSGLALASFSNGAAYADLDKDGDLDLIVNNNNNYPFIYSNNTIENKKGNYIRFQLNGTDKNKDGIGTIIQIETPDGKKQVQHYMPTKGYLSSHERFIHFGVGNNTSCNVYVTWPDGKKQIAGNVPTNKLYQLNNTEAKTDLVFPLEKSTPIFTDITDVTKLNFKPKENAQIDFKLEPLLPHQFSQMGPCIAVADVNGDGLDDFFVGGCKDEVGRIFTQSKNSTFTISKSEIFEADKKYEDVGAAFFDADKDGDMDLIVTCGGNEYHGQANMYPVRLYMNDGKGNFTKSTALENYFGAATAIAICDFDKDGYNDIFIGGRVVPGKYGLSPESFLLKNDGVKFKNIATSNISKIGMVTDATWADVNKDGWNDLVMVGEWMPVTVFINRNGVLDSTATTLPNSNGWWNSLTITDMDNDGNVDILAGNIGLNTRYKADETHPLKMAVSDFDNNGSTDCVVCVTLDSSKLYPLVLRDNLLDQMNFLKKKFLRYKDYSHAQLKDVFSKEQLSKANILSATNMQSSVYYGDGKGNFVFTPMVGRAQISPVNSIVVTDIDKDGKADIIVSGNDYSSEVETGRNDAGIGLLMKNNGNRKFRSVPVTQSGLNITGDVKCMKPIKIGNTNCLIVGKNQGYLQLIKIAE